MGGTIKVTYEKIELLGEGNYDTWAPQVQAVLTLNGLRAIVRNGVRPLAASDASDDEKNLVEAARNLDLEQDELAKALLLLHVSQRHHLRVSRAATAKDAWDALKGIYCSGSRAQLTDCRNQLRTLKLRPDETMEDYVSRAEALGVLRWQVLVSQYQTRAWPCQFSMVFPRSTAPSASSALRTQDVMRR